MNFITKLNEMVDGLRNNPDIFVAHFKVLPPNIESITKVEEYLGYILDNRITDFYKECGGIQLLWLYKDNPEFDIKKEYISKELESNPLFDFGMFAGDIGMLHDGNSWNELKTDGVILIPPIEISFLDQNYNDNSDENVDPEMFESFEIFENLEDLKIRRFEMFDVCVNIAFILDGKPYPAMLTAYDRNEYGDSKIVYFQEYLELILECKGASNRAHEFLID